MMFDSSSLAPIEKLRVQLLWAKRHHFAAGERHFSEHVPVCALWLVLQGHLEVRVDERTWKIDAGHVFVGAPCRRRLVLAPCGAIWLSAGLRTATSQGIDLLERGAPRVFHPLDKPRSQLEAVLSSLVASTETSGSGSDLMREGLSLALVGCLFCCEDQNFGSLLSNHLYPLWLRETLTRIDDQPAISVEELAQQAHFSTAQFRRIFRKQLGVAPRVYLRQRRLEMARLWLETSEDSLSQVAEKAGWGSPAHFSRAFKDRFGVTPYQWRCAPHSRL